MADNRQTLTLAVQAEVEVARRNLRALGATAGEAGSEVERGLGRARGAVAALDGPQSEKAKRNIVELNRVLTELERKEESISRQRIKFRTQALSAENRGEEEYYNTRYQIAAQAQRATVGEIARRVYTGDITPIRATGVKTGGGFGLGSIGASLVGSLGAAVSVTAITGAVRGVLDFAEAIERGAASAGIAAETFQVYSRALSGLGVDSDDTGDGLQKLNGALADVSNGVKNEATKALERMGLTQRILNGEITTADQLLDAVAGAAGTYGTESDFAADASKLFGQELAQRLLPALVGGADAYKTALDEARKFGGYLSGEQLAELRTAEHELDRFFENVKRHAAIFFADILVAARGYSRILREEGFFAFGTTDYEDAVQRGARVSPPQARARDEKDLGRFRPGTDIYNQLRADYVKKYGREPGAGGGAAAAAEDAPIVVTGRRLPPAPTRAAPAPRTSRAARTGSAAAYDPAALRLNDETPYAGLAPLSEFAEDTATLDKTIARLGVVQAILTETPPLSMKLAIDEEVLDTARTFVSDLSRGLVDAAFAGENLGDVLVNMLQRVASELASSALTSALSGGGGGGGIGGLVASIFGGGGGGIGDSIVSAFSGLGFASGGRPPLGKLSLVGERGPELFVPDVPGTIVPNNVAFGGGGAVYQFDLRGAVVTEQLLAEMNRLAQGAAQAGAVGGRSLAARDRTRAQQRRMAA